MTLDLFKEKGIPLAEQEFTWQDMVRAPLHKLDDDAMSRVRVMLMAGVEQQAYHFGHHCARLNKALQLPLARLRRVEQHQQVFLNWLIPADLTTLETSVVHEQTAIEIAGMVAQQEPDRYLAQVYRFGMLEHLDHLFRYAALMQRLDGGDVNSILQGYTDVTPAHPTQSQHRVPADDLRESYSRRRAAPVSKLNALTILAVESQDHDYAIGAGPQFQDTLARLLYAEITSAQEQLVTQYESIIDPQESWLEKLLLHEATEVYNYYSCLTHETEPRLCDIWERFLAYELGHLHVACELFERLENRDPHEILPNTLPPPLSYASQRDFVRCVLSKEHDLRAAGTRFIDRRFELSEAPSSVRYRAGLNREGSPSERVAAGYSGALHGAWELEAERDEFYSDQLQ